MNLKHTLFNCDWREISHGGKLYDVAFLDPPDSIGLKYNGFKDQIGDYEQFLKDCIVGCTFLAPIVWISFNAKWTFLMGRLFQDFLDENLDWAGRACVQTFTFGQNSRSDLTNGHRPLWRLKEKSARLFPDAIKVESWRQKNGDKRAAIGGKVPDDVFEFPRVTGNSSQRRSHHPTQLHEGLVERCLRLSSPVGGTVFDPFAGTGTTLRVARRISLHCTTADISAPYCRAIAKEHKMTRLDKTTYTLKERA
jgi:DNA modification methylase